MSNFKGRPEQPKCEHCGKALYKRMDPGAVKPADPYAWCRNAACSHFNQDQSGGTSRFQPQGGAAPAPAAKPAAKPVAKPVAAAAKPATPAKAPPKPAPTSEAAAKKAPVPVIAPRPAPPKTAKPTLPALADDALLAAVEASVEEAAAERKAGVEGEATAKARERIRKAMEAVEATYSRSVIGLALAIVAQETGSQAAANALITEFNLQEQYGIQPR
jgi:hypothetical protein